MVSLYGIIDTQIITAFQGSITSFRVLLMQMRGISFNGELLYTRTAGSGFSGVLTGVGGGTSLGKNRAGRLLILFGETGLDGGLFSHTSASVSVYGTRGGGYGSRGEDISISLKDGGS
jgi:hypothetical protein